MALWIGSRLQLKELFQGVQLSPKAVFEGSVCVRLSALPLSFLIPSERGRKMLPLRGNRVDVFVPLMK